MGVNLALEHLVLQVLPCFFVGQTALHQPLDRLGQVVDPTSHVPQLVVPLDGGVGGEIPLGDGLHPGLKAEDGAVDGAAQHPQHRRPDEEGGQAQQQQLAAVEALQAGVQGLGGDGLGEPQPRPAHRAADGEKEGPVVRGELVDQGAAVEGLILGGGVGAGGVRGAERAGAVQHKGLPVHRQQQAAVLRQLIIRDGVGDDGGGHHEKHRAHGGPAPAGALVNGPAAVEDAGGVHRGEGVGGHPLAAIQILFQPLQPVDGVGVEGDACRGARAALENALVVLAHRHHPQQIGVGPAEAHLLVHGLKGPDRRVRPGYAA